MAVRRQNSYEVRVPASTANLGAGFDCLGLALELYLDVRATVLLTPGARTIARTRGARGSALLPSPPHNNLICRTTTLPAAREGFTLPPVRLAGQKHIPLAGG